MPPTVNALVLLGNGDGTFQVSAQFVESDGVAIVLADFDGDGRLDLALGTNGVLIGLGNGNGTFQPLTPTPVAGDGLVGSIVVGDWNGDEAVDLFGTRPLGGADTWILMGEGDGTFASGPPPVVGSAAVGRAVSADFNRDARPDLAVGTARGVSVLVGNGDGTFQLPVNYNCAPTTTVAGGDFNRDGRPDLAATRWVQVSGEIGTVSVLFNLTP